MSSDELDRELRAGMYRKNDGLGGHHIGGSEDHFHRAGERAHGDYDDGDDYEDYEDEQGHPQRRRRSSGGRSGGGGYSGRPVIEGPTNVVYEAPDHVEYGNRGYGGAQRNPMANLIMFIVLIAILVYGYMAITGTSFDQLVAMVTGHKIIVANVTGT
jgi:hypothetical protein